MFAVDHAATALLVKRRFPSVSLVPLLIAVTLVLTNVLARGAAPTTSATTASGPGGSSGTSPAGTSGLAA